MRAGAIACGVLALSACALEPPVSQEHMAFLVQIIGDCGRANVDRLDDGISDARTIASAVIGSCRSAIQELDEANGSGLSLNAYAIYMQPNHQEIRRQKMLDAMTRLVLTRRSDRARSQ